MIQAFKYKQFAPQLDPPVRRAPTRKSKLCPICKSEVTDSRYRAIDKAWIQPPRNFDRSKLEVFQLILEYLRRQELIKIPLPSGGRIWERDPNDYHRVRAKPKGDKKELIPILAYYYQKFTNIQKPEQVFICGACSQRYHRHPNRVEIYAALRVLGDWEMGR